MTNSQWYMEIRLNNMNKNNLKIGFIGCGKMASAIIQGVLSSKFLTGDKIIASEISEDFAKERSQTLGIDVCTNNSFVAKNSDIIFLATKPHFIKQVLSEIKSELKKDKIIVSIAAGVSTKTIEQESGNLPVIRVMPNAPMLVLEGMSGVVKGEFATIEHVNYVVELLSNLGKCIVLEEDKIDVLTAISGSGPAFFYKIFHEMALAGEKLGLDYDKALTLAIQTAIGSAKVMEESSDTAEELVSMVATKGGCTAVGVDFMKEKNTQELFFELMERTAQKAKALG